jgi:hypothetical protein
MGPRNVEAPVPGTESTDTIANRYWEFRGRRSSYLSFERTHGQPAERKINPAKAQRRLPMKKIMLAVALIVASAAPVMAEGYPNPYQTQF